MEIENYIDSQPSTVIRSIDVTIIPKKETTQQFRYRFIGQIGITIIAIGASVISLIQSGDEINSTTLCSAVISGAILLHVKAPKLY